MIRSELPRYVRALRVLLLLYPRRFRADYGAEMIAVLQQRGETLREQQGRFAAALGWLRAAADLVVGAIPEHLRERRLRAVDGAQPKRNRRSTRGDSIMSSLWQDARLALRNLFRQPTFAVVAVATLAFGIGANTAVFSMVSTVLLQPLPYPNADALVRIWSSNPTQEGRSRYFTSPLSYYEWQERATSFVDIGAAWPRDVTLTDDVGTPTRIRTLSTTLNWFDILNVPPHIGRAFHTNDASLAWGNWLLVLSHGLWQDRFGADPSVVGTAVEIDGEPAEIIGVLAPGTQFPENVDLFTNFVPPLTQHAQYMDVIARIRPGIETQQALAELQAVAENLETEFPAHLAGWSVDMAPLREDVVGDVRPALLMLMVATGFVLVIACANVANLLLARTERRFQELAVRRALGAGEARLVRQLLTESIVLALLGASAGIGVAFLGLHLLTTVIPATLPRFNGVHVDLGTLGVTGLCAIVTGVTFGLAPALQLGRVNLQSELKEGGQRGSGSRRKLPARDIFVVMQLALAVVVTAGAGLLVKSFSNLRSTDPGFDISGALSFELNLPSGAYADLREVLTSYETILDQLGTLPGVKSVAASSSLPLGGQLDYLLEIFSVGETSHSDGQEPYAWYRMVSPDFFSTAGIPLLAGRTFDSRDRPESPGVVVINQTLARVLAPDDDPVGLQLTGVSGGFGPMGYILNRQTEVIGVVDDVRYGSLRDPAEPSVYFPMQQAPFRRQHVVIRTETNPTALVPSVRATLDAIDPSIPLQNVSTLRDVFDRSIARDRFSMLLITIFGGLALSLASVGIYGVLAYSVAERTRELGVRIALGASSADVLWLVMRRTLKLVCVGAILGLLGASAATNALSSQLFGVGSRDPWTFAAVIILLVAVAFIASYFPAFRATRVSPVTALRNE